MSESLPIINGMVQNFGIEFCEYNIFARKMYYVKFKTNILFVK
jgi:hypothetical protein